MNTQTYYKNWQERILRESHYAGVRIVKAPTDFFVYQEIIFELQPEVVIEIGNHAGGMLLAFAHWMDAISGPGIVFGVDIDHSLIDPKVRRHNRVCLIQGDAATLAPTFRNFIKPGERVLVIEDSSHTYENTLAVLEAYQGYVTPGSYFIVEDTICHHGLDEGPFPGPAEAVRQFLIDHWPDFGMDKSREPFGLTWNPGGYLLRL